MAIGIIGILAALYIFQATQLGVFQTSMPTVLVNYNHKACLKRHQNPDFPKNEISHYCRCFAEQSGERFYTEEYFLILIQRQFNWHFNGNGDIGEFDGGRTREIVEYCRIDLEYEFHEPEIDYQE